MVLNTGASIWDVASGRLLLNFRNTNDNKRHPDPEVSIDAIQLVSGVGFSPSGASFAICDMLGIKLIETQTGLVLRVIDAPYRYHSGKSQFVFSADGQLITLLGTYPEQGESPTISTWSTSSGERLLTLPIEAEAAAFSADGKWFAAGEPRAQEALAVWQNLTHHLR